MSVEVKVRIEFESGNEAFQELPANKCADILEKFACRVRNTGRNLDLNGSKPDEISASANLMDTNGNFVGTGEFTAKYTPEYGPPVSQGQYLKHWRDCPVCRGSQVEDITEDNQGDSFEVEMECNDCGASWKKLFELTGYELKD